MEHFDPAAATAAYLATMSPAEMAKAIAYTRGGYWMILWGLLVSLAVAFVIVKTNLLTGIRDGIEGNRKRPYIASLVISLVYVVISFVLSLPWDLYVNWYREKFYGLNNQTWVEWLGDAGKGLAISVVAAAIILPLLYLAIRKAGKMWWLWGAAVVGVFTLIGMVLAPTYIEPMFNTYTPAPPGAVRDAVVDLAHKTGTPDDKIFIFNGTKQSDRYTANVSGVFGSARVALSDAMFKKNADLSEIRAVVGHEMGHYVLNHGLKGAAIITVLSAIAFWLVNLLFPLFRGLLGGDRIRDISDPAGMPVLFAVLAFVSTLATPAINTLTRTQEAEADHFSMVHANEPDGMARALIKTAEYRAPSPTPLEEIFFYDHPSVENRIRAAMEWKAAHPKPGAPVAEPATTPNTEWPSTTGATGPRTGAATRDHPATPSPDGKPTGKE